MTTILHDVLPLTLPSPFLTIIGECFGISLIITAIVAISIRLLWRRGKGMYDL